MDKVIKMTGEKADSTAIAPWNQEFGVLLGFRYIRVAQALFGVFFMGGVRQAKGKRDAAVTILQPAHSIKRLAMKSGLGELI